MIIRSDYTHTTTQSQKKIGVKATLLKKIAYLLVKKGDKVSTKDGFDCIFNT